MKFYNGLDSGQAASETWVPELVDTLGLALPLPLPLTLSGGVHE